MLLSTVPHETHFLSDRVSALRFCEQFSMSLPSLCRKHCNLFQYHGMNELDTIPSQRQQLSHL